MSYVDDSKLVAVLSVMEARLKKLETAPPPSPPSSSPEEKAAQLQDAIDKSQKGFYSVLEGAYRFARPLKLKGRTVLNLSPTAYLEAGAKMDRLIDARDCFQPVCICGLGRIEGAGKVKTVTDFSTKINWVTHHRLDGAQVSGAADVSDSCLVNFTGNSGFQLNQPWLDGRVGAAGEQDSAHYGIIMDTCGGQNTLYLGDINNFFKKACIRLGGGALTLFGGALEGGLSGGANIVVTSTSGGPQLRVFGTWMESSADNIRIVEGKYSPGPLDLEPSHMVAGRSGFANLRSVTKEKHLYKLRVRGGVWINAPGPNIDVDLLGGDPIIDKGAADSNDVIRLH